MALIRLVDASKSLCRMETDMTAAIGADRPLRAMHRSLAEAQRDNFVELHPCADSDILPPFAMSTSAESRELLRSSSPGKTAAPQHKPRWLTPEFFVYYIVSQTSSICTARRADSVSFSPLTCFPLPRAQILGWAYYAGGRLVWDVSLEAEADSKHYRQLKPGWMLGRRVDLSDSQYRFFREELPLLTVAAAGFLALSHAVRHLSNNVSDKSSAEPQNKLFNA